MGIAAIVSDRRVRVEVGAILVEGEGEVEVLWCAAVESAGKTKG